MKLSKSATYLIAISVTVLTGVAFASGAWNPPVGNPPANNTPEPINVGSTPQTKNGPLTINGILQTTSGGIKFPDGTVQTTAAGAVAPTEPDAPAGPVVTGTCGVAGDKTAASQPTVDLCASGSATEVANNGSTWSWLCNGSGGGFADLCSAPRETGWVTVANADKPAQDLANVWGTEKVSAWTANGDIAGVRVSGSTDDGGYCYASWGSGNIATWRHDPSSGYYNLDNRYYSPSGTCLTNCGKDATPLTTGTGKDATIVTTGGKDGTPVYVRTYSSGCPANPPIFTNDGVAKICQSNWNAGAFTLKSIVNLRGVNYGTAFKLKSNFVDGPSSGAVSCKMEVLYK